jgi:hypothetical protein
MKEMKNSTDKYAKYYEYCKGCKVYNSKCYFISHNGSISKELGIDVDEYIMKCPCMECVIKVMCDTECKEYSKLADLLQETIIKKTREKRKKVHERNMGSNV